MPRNNLRKDCQKAIKILTQYERLAHKYGSQLSQEKIAALNTKRDHGTISFDDLPGILQREFPGEFVDMTLQDIEAVRRNIR